MLDNSFGIIQTHLKNQGHTVFIEDRQTIDDYQRVNPCWYAKILRVFTKQYLFFYYKKHTTTVVMSLQSFFLL